MDILNTDRQYVITVINAEQYFNKDYKEQPDSKTGYAGFTKDTNR